MALTYQLIEVDPKQVAANPDNPRHVDEKAPSFIELRDSIAAAGVRVPIAVRQIGKGKRPFELLAGTRRLAAAVAAKMTPIPALDYGEIDDDVAFEITFLENLKRLDLTAIEAGRAVSTLLGRFNDDMAVVAARIGQTAHWVATHAQIDRGLSAEWKQAAQTNERFIPWSAAHWIEIARLAPAVQAQALKHFCGSAWYGAGRFSVAEVQQHLTSEQRLLKAAPFEIAACGDCPKRTGYAPLLWAQAAPEASGTKDKCLDPKCWDRKLGGAERAKFERLKARHNQPDLVPLEQSTAERYVNEAGYKARQQRKKIFGKALLQSDEVKIVTAKTPGAKPALVVGGRGKGALKWILAPPEKAGGQRPATGLTAKKEAAAKQRTKWRRKVQKSVAAALAGRAYQDVGPDKALLTAVLLDRRMALTAKDTAQLTATLAAGQSVVPALIEGAWAAVVRVLKERVKATWFSQCDYDKLVLVAALFGIDMPFLVAAAISAEKAAERPAKKKVSKKKTAKKADGGAKGPGGEA